MSRIYLSPILVTLLLAALLAVSTGGSGHPGQTSNSNAPPYHSHLPAEPLPPTLDASPFAGDRVAFISYALAARTKSILYQVPCYCPCNRQHGHESLLDCFTGKHGAKCGICEKEVIFCYRESRKGRTAPQIRDDIRAGKAWKIDLKLETERLSSHLDACKR